MSTGSGYAATHQTPAGADLGLINLTGAATVRCHLYEIVVGSDATPADAALELALNRSTSVGTGGSALTEQKLDPLTVNNSTGAAVGGTFTAEPADGNDLLNFGLNQRATFRWVAAPNREFVSTASANNGLFWRCVSVSTGTPNLNSTIYWWE